MKSSLRTSKLPDCFKLAMWLLQAALCEIPKPKLRYLILNYHENGSRSFIMTQCFYKNLFLNPKVCDSSNTEHVGHAFKKINFLLLWE